jgi:hypothetical protein
MSGHCYLRIVGFTWRLVTCGRPSREIELLDTRVLGQRLAGHGAQARHDVEHPIRQARLADHRTP